MTRAKGYAVISGTFNTGKRRAVNSFRHPSTLPMNSIASFATVDGMLQEVSLAVSSFLTQRRSNDDRLTEEASLKIRVLAKTLPHQSNREVRICLGFWNSLERVYGFNGDRRRDLTISLLDSWQAWINCSVIQDEPAVLDATLCWLEEFEQAGVGWRPARIETNFFATGRIRDAAHQFLRIQQVKFPEVRKISDIRPATKVRNKVFPSRQPQRRMTSQPVHVPGVGAYFGCNLGSSPEGLWGNIGDYWIYPR